MNIRKNIRDIMWELEAWDAWCGSEYATRHLYDLYKELTDYAKANGIATDALCAAYEAASQTAQPNDGLDCLFMERLEDTVHAVDEATIMDVVRAIKARKWEGQGDVCVVWEDTYIDFVRYLQGHARNTISIEKAMQKAQDAYKRLVEVPACSKAEWEDAIKKDKVLFDELVFCADDIEQIQKQKTFRP